MPQTMKTMQQDTQEVLTRLRRELGGLVARAIPAADRASEVQTMLGIDKKLAWRLHRFLNDPDIMAASLQLPSQSGMKIIHDAMRKAGAPDAGIEASQDAFESFQDAIQSHAGERSSMNMMIASASPTALTDAAREHQANAFKANSFIWGVQAKLQLSSLLLHPSEDNPELVDIAALRGLSELRRIRSNVPWVIGRSRCIDDDGKIRTAMDLEPLEEQPEDGSDLPPVSLLRSFCSDPLPGIRRVMGLDGHLEDELVDGPVGNKGVIDCFTGELARGAGVRYASEQNKVAEMSIRVRTPLRWLFIDLHVHRDIAPPQKPYLRLYSDLGGLGKTPARTERDRLLLTTEIQELGSEPGSAYLTQLKKYPEMLDYAFERLGWDRSSFKHYRVLMEFPVMPASVDIGWMLPERK